MQLTAYTIDRNDLVGCSHSKQLFAAVRPLGAFIVLNKGDKTLSLFLSICYGEGEHIS